jgi:phosphoribosylanthranilate isomerase
MRPLIKICGVSTPEAIHAAASGGASHVGFVHFPKSPRHLAPEAMGALAQQVPAHIDIVAVLVDPDDLMLDAVMASGRVSAIQLHGSESAGQVSAVAARTGLEIWKAIPVACSADIAAAQTYAGVAARILFDAKTPAGAALPGGMGHRFDWRLLTGQRFGFHWGLSGGLDADNVAEAFRMTGAPLVDVSSGVESAPGRKDVDKIAAFCKAVAAS